jgi:hypothetical protein
VSKQTSSQNPDAMSEPKVGAFKLQGFWEFHFDAYIGEQGERIFPYSKTAEAAAARLRFYGRVQVFSPLTPEQAKGVNGALREFTEKVQQELGITKRGGKSWIDQMKFRIPSWSRLLAGSVAWCLSRTMGMS